MYYYPFHDLSVSALGIGSLRLPARPEDPNCIDREKAQKVIASFVQLAAKLHIHTVAEGIETQSQLAFLRAVGCDMIQGYVFSKPLSISDFERWAPPAIEG